MDLNPKNIKTTEEDLKKANLLLASPENYIIRYLRTDPRVALANIPVRDPAGALLPDIPPKKKRVICKGTPLACLVAVKDGDDLLIGWSRRLDEKKLLETQDLHLLFRQILKNTKDVTEDSEDYTKQFDRFCASLMSVLTYSPTKDLEIAFSKKAGRKAAVVRAMKDSLTFGNRSVMSKSSGAVPNNVAKNLKWFIKLAEDKFNTSAANVSKTETTKELVAA
jgi:hypothetical protein